MASGYIVSARTSPAKADKRRGGSATKVSFSLESSSLCTGYCFPSLKMKPLDSNHMEGRHSNALRSPSRRISCFEIALTATRQSIRRPHRRRWCPIRLPAGDCHRPPTVMIGGAPGCPASRYETLPALAWCVAGWTRHDRQRLATVIHRRLPPAARERDMTLAMPSCVARPSLGQQEKFLPPGLPDV